MAPRVPLAGGLGTQRHQRLMEKTWVLHRIEFHLPTIGKDISSALRWTLNSLSVDMVNLDLPFFTQVKRGTFEGPTRKNGVMTHFTHFQITP